MSDTFWLGLIGGIVSVVLAALQIVTGLLNRQAFQAASVQRVKTDERVEDVHSIVNSQRAQMMAEIQSLKDEVVALKAVVKTSNKGA